MKRPAESPADNWERTRREMRVLTFELDLMFPSEVAADPNTLMETIVDAVKEYDGKNRLLPGVRPPAGGERIVGSSIGATKMAIVVDDSFRGRLPETYEESTETRDKILTASMRIDRAVARLRVVQADLWDAWHDLKTDDLFVLLKMERKADVTVARALAALPVEPPKLAGQRKTRRRRVSPGVPSPALAASSGAPLSQDGNHAQPDRDTASPRRRQRSDQHPAQPPNQPPS